MARAVHLVAFRLLASAVCFWLLAQLLRLGVGLRRAVGRVLLREGNLNVVEIKTMGTVGGGFAQ